MNSKAVDVRVPSESLAPARRLRRAELQTLRLLTTHQGRAVPPNGGMLIRERHREHYLPDCEISGPVVAGADKRRPVARREVVRDWFWT
jgi:hypothetical protein